ncbi:MAG: protease complex subunit PrcB family protein [Lachnospiraceae bacterium]|nr:protease complex subunit PrcB family protein [Lachnospiraceae bacterium]
MNKSKCVVKNLKKVSCLALLVALLSCTLLCGCSIIGQSDDKVKDLEFTVISEERLGDELKEIIEQRKEEPFKLTYHDGDYLYLVVGYGKQSTGGYSIAVDELYLTEDAIKVRTTLLGPGPEDAKTETPSYPYIVLKTMFLDKTVLFE